MSRRSSTGTLACALFAIVTHAQPEPRSMNLTGKSACATKILRILQIIHDHEAEADGDRNPRSPSQKISKPLFSHVRGSPVRHQTAEHVARHQPPEVSVIVRSAKQKAEHADID